MTATTKGSSFFSIIKNDAKETIPKFFAVARSSGPEIGVIGDKIRLGLAGSMTVKELFASAVVGIELYAFFCVGEIIGRRSLFGYNVKKAH